MSGRFDHLLDDVDPADAEPLVDASFQPADLTDVLAGHAVQPEPSILRRDDGQCLFYPGQVNEVHGDSGIGKGWTVLHGVRQQLTAGRTVMLIDVEDVADSIVARLRILGATDDEIRERLIYIRPTDPFTAWNVDHLVDLVAERNVSLVVLDSLGECFGLDGVNEDRDNEVGPWLRRVARRIADAGPAVGLVDHSTKANDNPLHPSGSKRKRAAIGGASYLVTASTPLVAGKGGRLKITCAKDRHGHYGRGEHVADLVLSIDAVGAPRWELYAPNPTDSAAALPVELACRAAVAAVEAEGAAMSLRSLRSTMTVKAGNDIKVGGIELAVGRGLLVERSGPRNARMFGLPSEVET